MKGDGHVFDSGERLTQLHYQKCMDAPVNGASSISVMNVRLLVWSVFLLHQQESDHGNDHSDQPHPVLFQEAGCGCCRRERRNHYSRGGLLWRGYCCWCFLFHNRDRNRGGFDFRRCSLDNFFLGLLHCRFGGGMFCHDCRCGSGLIGSCCRSSSRCSLLRGGCCWSRCRSGGSSFLRFGCASRNGERGTKQCYGKGNTVHS